uniref:Uncharacterized protein n=1 Tax=Helianthus annuus TaxID=4232 RepID=A0A251S1Y1_HELAN
MNISYHVTQFAGVSRVVYSYTGLLQLAFVPKDTPSVLHFLDLFIVCIPRLHYIC